MLPEDEGVRLSDYCMECVRTLEPRGKSNRYKLLIICASPVNGPNCARLYEDHFAFIHFGINLAITVEVMYEGIPGVSALSAVPFVDDEPDLAPCQSVYLNGRTAEIGVRRGQSASDCRQNPRRVRAAGNGALRRSFPIARVTLHASKWGSYLTVIYS